MKRVDFLHPEFQKGMNSTVRLGDRSDAFYPGLMLRLCETGAPDWITIGTVYKVLVKKFSELNLHDIAYQHDIETRTKKGLWEAMVRAYGDKISLESIVTVIYFEVENERL